MTETPAHPTPAPEQTSGQTSEQAKDTVFLHIGTRKSGTSYLQKALRESVPQLEAQGLNLAYHTRKGQVERQLTPFQEYAAGGPRAAVEASNAELLQRITKATQTRHLITLEDLAELPEQAADALVEPLLGFDLHLVVTARHWGLTIPSEWQQDVKERKSVTYRDFLDAIRDRTPGSAQFLMRQDLPVLLQRWGKHLPADRIHVVAVPPSSRTEGTLMELFCGLIGVDPSTLKIPTGDINASISLDQAELLRQVNIALGDRLPDLEGDYRFGVREWLTRGSLMKRKSGSIRIPAEDAGWCTEAAQAQFDAVKGLGVDLIGDPADLVVAAGTKTGPAAVSETEVNDVAVNALADLATRHWAELSEQAAERAALVAERDALAARIAELEAPKSFRERLRDLRG